MGIFDQNNRYSSKINRFEYKQWRFFQNWIKKNGIMNLYWIDTTLINTINVFLMFSVHSLDQFEGVFTLTTPLYFNFDLYVLDISSPHAGLLYS